MIDRFVERYALGLLLLSAGFAAGSAASYGLYSLAYGTFVGPNGLIAGLATGWLFWMLACLFFWRNARALQSITEYWRDRAWAATGPDRSRDAEAPER